ncbi:hypothetical protein ACIB24_14885 [Spongisporangium articulatum]|uniref:Uncharacterized protein n=1 Tax=Spongisporangium articulatum TaxID=3362603 RepID=A0ABW8AR10_9ACTN
MIRVATSEEFMSSLDDALQHPDAPERHAFMASELFAIVDYIREHWDRLVPGRTDPYRRTLVATYPRADENPRFYYSVRARLRADGVIELESISIDWDYRPHEG